MGRWRREGSTGLTLRTLPHPTAANPPGRMTGATMALTELRAIRSERTVLGDVLETRGMCGGAGGKRHVWGWVLENHKAAHLNPPEGSAETQWDMAKDSFITGWLCQMQGGGQTLGSGSLASAPELGPAALMPFRGPPRALSQCRMVRPR